MKKTVYYFLSNRCSYSRSKQLLEKLNNSFNLTVLVSGALLLEGFEDILLEIRSQFHTIVLDVRRETNTRDGMAGYASELTYKIWDYLAKKRPDVVMLWADRFELLPVAMIAKYMNIPIAHIQGGEVTGNIDNYVRNAISNLSDIHFVSNLDAANRLRSFGLRDIYETGCPSLDMIKDMKFEEPTHDYIISIFHPHTEEIDKIKEQTESILNDVLSICDEHKLSLYWFASNNDPGHLLVNQTLSNITIIKNLVGEKFLQLLYGARMIVGNSSSGIRESSFMGVPSVVVGDRQRSRLYAKNVISCDFDDAKEAMEIALKMNSSRSTLYGDGQSSDRIVKILERWLDGKKV